MAKGHRRVSGQWKSAQRKVFNYLGQYSHLKEKPLVILCFIFLQWESQAFLDGHLLSFWNLACQNHGAIVTISWIFPILTQTRKVKPVSELTLIWHIMLGIQVQQCQGTVIQAAFDKNLAKISLLNKSANKCNKERRYLLWMDFFYSKTHSA